MGLAGGRQPCRKMILVEVPAKVISEELTISFNARDMMEADNLFSRLLEGNDPDTNRDTQNGPSCQSATTRTDSNPSISTIF